MGFAVNVKRDVHLVNCHREPFHSVAVSLQMNVILQINEGERFYDLRWVAENGVHWKRKNAGTSPDAEDKDDVSENCVHVDDIWR